MGINLPTGVEYNAKKTALIATAAVDSDLTIDLSSGNYASTVKEINASDCEKAVTFTGDAQANIIRAGKGGSVMDGGDGKDQLFGGEGVDTFKYTVKQGADVFTSVEAQDIVELSGTTLTNLTFSDKDNVVTVAFTEDPKTKLTINKAISTDTLVFKIGDETYEYGKLETGVVFDDNKKKTAISVGSAAEDGIVINAKDIVSTAKSIIATTAGGPVNLTGNDNANAIYAGDHGSTLYGGSSGSSAKAVADKLYGGAGKDVFVYSAGDGKDVVYKYNGSHKDFILVDSGTKLDSTTVKVAANKVTLTTKNGTKDVTLTLDDPQGRVSFHYAGADSDTEVYGVGINFDTGISYNQKKTAIIVESTATKDVAIDLTSADYASTVKEINASDCTKAVVFTGNSAANVFYAGSGNSTMNGGEGKDQLHGGVGSDTFVWHSSLGGSDQIYDYAQGDVVSVMGDTKFDKTNFADSGKNVVLTIGKNKLTFANATDQTIVAVAGDDTVYYGSLPGGVTYKDNRKTLDIGEAYTGGTIDVADYAAAVVTLDASNSTAENVVLKGSKKAKVLNGGKGSTMLIGGPAADVITAGTGSDTIVYSTVTGGGADQVFNFDYEKDKIKLSDTTVTVTAFSEKKNDVILTVGKGSITLKDFLKDNPRGSTITVLDKDDKTITYKTLPENVTYKSGKLTATKEFSGELNASEIGLPITELNASAATTTTVLRAADGSDTKIVAGKGGSELYGGSGNDTLVGGKGVDIFQMSGGKDWITGYTSGQDSIHIESELRSGTADGNNVVLKTTDGQLTIKSVVNKVIEVNGTTYKFSRTTTKLDDARYDESAQLPSKASDYWFMPSDETSDELGSIIGEAATADEAAIASMSDNFDAAKRLMNNLAANVATKKRR